MRFFNRVGFRKAKANFIKSCAHKIIALLIYFFYFFKFCLISVFYKIIKNGIIMILFSHYYYP